MENPGKRKLNPAEPKPIVGEEDEQTQQMREGQIANSTVLQQLLSLPSHILIEILSWLPIKSLVSCKGTCKLFHDLISDPYFIQLYESRSPTHLLVTSFSGRWDTTALHLLDLRDRGTKSRIQLPIVDFKLVNACNGLICLQETQRLRPEAGDYQFCVCNPILGEFITLPKLPGHHIVVGMALGFSSKTSEYKVLRVSGEYVDQFEAEVYTIGSGSWRNIGKAPDGFMINGNGCTFVNGAVHWDAHQFAGGHLIRAFNFDTEQFLVLPGPSDLPRHNAVIEVGVLKECLGLSVCDARNWQSGRHTAYFWRMKDYGVKESWTKLYTFGHYSLYNPLTVLGDGRVLMKSNNDGLVSYDPNDGVINRLSEYGVKHCFCTTSHRLSFASLRRFAKENVKEHFDLMCFMLGMVSLYTGLWKMKNGKVVEALSGRRLVKDGFISKLGAILADKIAE